MISYRFTVIILATGYSSRMRVFNPLLSLGDGTVLDRVISLFKHQNVDVILVTGWRHNEIVSRVNSSGTDVTIVENPLYEQGVFTSIKAGVKKIKSSYKAFFIMPLDISLVRPATVSKLIHESIKNPNKIVYPVFDNNPGYPVLLPSCLTGLLLNWNEEGGIEAILDSQPDEKTIYVKVSDSNIIFEVDSPEDYQRMINAFERYDLPSEEELTVILNDVCHTPQKVQLHCQKVSEIAMKISEALHLAGQKVDREIIYAAAMLHDMAKGQLQHDIAGGTILHNLGFNKIGDIVGLHTDLGGGLEANLEAKVVYLADKFVRGEDVVSIDNRYSLSDRQFVVTPEIEMNINKRKNRALNTKRELESLLGYSIDRIIFT